MVLEVMATSPIPVVGSGEMTRRLQAVVKELSAVADLLAGVVPGLGRDEALELAVTAEDAARLVGVAQLSLARAVDEPAPAAASRSLALVDHQGDLAAPKGTAGEGAAREGVVDDGDGPGSRCGPASEPPGVSGGTAVDSSPSAYRHGVDLLAVRLRITRREALRRVRLARQVLPGRSLLGEPLAPANERLGEVVDRVDTAATNHVLRAVTRIARVAGPGVAREVEEFLAHQALVFDPDAVGRMADRAIAYLDPDGAAPRESAVLREGVTIGRTREGLTPIRLVVDPVGLETLMAVFDAATNPRSAGPCDPNAGGPEAGDPEAGGPDGGGPDGGGREIGDPEVARDGASSGTDAPAGVGMGAGAPVGAGTDVRAGAGADEQVGAGAGAGDAAGASAAGSMPALSDGRSRARIMLDGLLAACGAALRSREVGAVGGLPAQVMVTIPFAGLSDALTRVGRAAVDIVDVGRRGRDADRASRAGRDDRAGRVEREYRAGRDDPAAAGHPPWEESASEQGRVAVLPHAGPVPVAMVRRLACDADIIPVVLGTKGEVLDLGRGHRLFPARLRRALIARDGGCVFPGCQVPAPWCEGHHVVEWWRGGDTDLADGALLCPFHHHAVHTGAWTVTRDPDRGGRPVVSPPWVATPYLRSNPHHTGLAS